MANKHFSMTPEERRMIAEVMRNAYRQDYTPERLCSLQKVIDAQHFYWWLNDLKCEEYALELFPEEFDAYFTGIGKYENTALDWARNAKYGNSFRNTAHMGHQPLVWFMDEEHARAIFFFESHMTFLDDPDELLEQFLIYCNDFEKQENGMWKLTNYRLLQTKQCGEYRQGTSRAPEGYVFENWEEME